MTEIKNKLYQVIQFELNGMTHYITSKGILSLDIPFEEVKRQLSSNENLVITKKETVNLEPAVKITKKKTETPVNSSNEVIPNG